MLRLTRSLHTSRVALQNSVENNISGKESLEKYLNYFKTEKSLRPFVYRKRNASELLSRDLWDPVAKKRITPQEPPVVPKASVLSNILLNIQDRAELHEYKLKLIELAKDPKYTKATHINGFLRKSAELQKFGHAISFLYTQKTLEPILTVDNLNLILFYQYINPTKQLHNSNIKITIAKRKLKVESDQVTRLLEAAIYLKNKSPIPAELSLEISKQLESESIPKPLDLAKNLGASQSLLNQYQFEYLTLKPIAIEFQNHELQNVTNVSHAIKFVKSYEELQQKLGKQDLFEIVREESQFGKYPEPTEPNEPEQPSEEPVVEETK